MRIENKDILGYMAKDGKEKKEVCPTCFGENKVKLVRIPCLLSWMTGRSSSRSSVRQCP